MTTSKFVKYSEKLRNLSMQWLTSYYQHDRKRTVYEYRDYDSDIKFGNDGNLWKINAQELQQWPNAEEEFLAIKVNHSPGKLHSFPATSFLSYHEESPPGILFWNHGRDLEDYDGCSKQPEEKWLLEGLQQLETWLDFMHSCRRELIWIQCCCGYSDIS